MTELRSTYLPPEQRAPGGGLPRPLRGDSRVPIVAGLLVVTAGFALMVLVWGRVAGLGEVHAQLPWAVGGGAAALALLLTGLTAISVQTRRRDAAVEDARLAALVGLVRNMTQAGLPRDANGVGSPSSVAAAEAER